MACRAFPCCEGGPSRVAGRSSSEGTHIGELNSLRARSGQRSARHFKRSAKDYSSPSLRDIGAGGLRWQGGGRCPKRCCQTGSAGLAAAIDECCGKKTTQSSSPARAVAYARPCARDGLDHSIASAQRRLLRFAGMQELAGTIFSPMDLGAKTLAL